MDAPLVNVGIMTGKALFRIQWRIYPYGEQFLPDGRTTRVVCKRKYRV